MLEFTLFSHLVNVVAYIYLQLDISFLQKSERKWKRKIERLSEEKKNIENN